MALPNPRPPFVVPDPVLAEDGAFSTPFTDFARDPVSNDLVIPPVLTFAFEAIRLRLLARLQFFQGEWFLDVRQGMPYFQAVFVKNPEISLIQSIFRRAILSTPGVSSIIRMETRLDSATRRLIVDPLEIQLATGEVFRSQPNDFIVEIF